MTSPTGKKMFRKDDRAGAEYAKYNAIPGLMDLVSDLQSEVEAMDRPNDYDDGPTRYEREMQNAAKGLLRLPPEAPVDMLPEEDLQIFYGNNSFVTTFRYFELESIQSWVDMLPEEAFPLLRTMRFRSLQGCLLTQYNGALHTQLSVDIDYGRSGPRAVMDDKDERNACTNPAFSGWKVRLQAIVDRINTRDDGTGVRKQDVVDLVELFNRIARTALYNICSCSGHLFAHKVVDRWASGHDHVLKDSPNYW